MHIIIKKGVNTYALNIPLYNFRSKFIVSACDKSMNLKHIPAQFSKRDILESIIDRGWKLYQLVDDDEYIIWLILKKTKACDFL